MRLVSASEMMRSVLPWRMRLPDFLKFRCRLPERIALTLPRPVILTRALVPLWVFNFGMRLSLPFDGGSLAITGHPPNSPAFAADGVAYFVEAGYLTN